MNNTTSDKPRILIVIPTLGRRIEYLRLALESIELQKPTLYDTVMIFPLDNAEAVKLAEEFNVNMVNDPGGMSAAVNAGIATAKPWHEFIVWMGDDDLLMPNSLETSLMALDKRPDAVVAFGYCDYINSNGDFIFSSRAGNIAPWIMTWGPDLVPMMGLMMRISALKQVGEFDVNNKWCMDLDMLLRLRKIGKFVNTKSTLSAFRWHPNSQTVSNRPILLKEAEIVKRKHLPKYVKPFAFLWEWPVRLATAIAAKRVNALALRKQGL